MPPLSGPIQVFSVATVCIVVLVREEPPHDAEPSADGKFPENCKLYVVSDVGNVAVLHKQLLRLSLIQRRRARKFDKGEGLGYC